jgi:hypothetical protein
MVKKQEPGSPTVMPTELDKDDTHLADYSHFFPSDVSCVITHNKSLECRELHTLNHEGWEGRLYKSRLYLVTVANKAKCS